MCCIVSVLLMLGPRVAILVWWLLQPMRWSSTFNTFIWPLLGAIFLPFATMMYVLVFPNGITGLDWLWLGLALVADIAWYSGGGYGNRNRLRR